MEIPADGVKTRKATIKMDRDESYCLKKRLAGISLQKQ